MSDKHVDLDYLSRIIDEIYSLNELRDMLNSGRPLRIKYGVDVTAPFLHIGHAVNLWAMRHFQEHGHIVVFLLGDFTTRIGDPTGKSKAREVPTEKEIKRNAEEFIKQVGQILLTSPDVFEIRRNSEWYEDMPLSEFLSLLSMVTHARLIQRDMFQKRINNNDEIFVHELLYPVLQGYDSKMLNSDLTIVGTDQLFNELMGRFYQEKFGQQPQVVATTLITPGTDGKEKQSKSLGNYIALADSARDKFGKVMSIPDSLIVSYLEVYTEVSQTRINELQEGIAAGSLNPMIAKKELAEAIVARYHGPTIAIAERRWFEDVFSKGNLPSDIPEIAVVGTDSLLDLLKKCLPKQSNSQLRRLVEQGAVRLNNEKASSESIYETPNVEDGHIIQIGKKKWFKISMPH